MSIKIYSSFEQIETNLEILNLNRKISYQKCISSFRDAKDFCSRPLNIANDFIDLKKFSFSNVYSSALTFVLPHLIDWLTKRKRGN